MRARGVASGVVLAVVLMLCATASAHIRHIDVIGGEGPRSIAISAAGKQVVGRLTVLVRNDSWQPARPTAHLIPASHSADVQLQTLAAVLLPGEVEPVSLRFAAGDKSAMTGTVTISLSGKRPTRQATIAVAPETPPSGSAVQPEEVTVHLTVHCPTWFGHFLCGSSATPTVGISPAAFASLGAGSRRLTSTSTGSPDTTVQLTQTKAGAQSLPDGLIPIKVQVAGVSHGEYTTTFVLDPDAKHDGQLKIIVDAEVWWLYPLIALLAGAVAGFVTRWVGGARRERDLLKERLVTARSQYETEIKTRSHGIYPLRSWFGPFTTAVPSIPRRREYDSDDLSGFAECWKQTQEARSTSDLEEAEKVVKSLEEDLTNWRKINEALKALDVSFQRSVPDQKVREGQAPVYQATIALLSGGLVTRPETRQAATQTIEAIEDQGEIVEAYEPARIARKDSDHDNQHLDAYDPKTIYKGVEAGPLQRTQLETRTLIDDLNKATAELRKHPAEPATIALKATAGTNAPAAVTAPALAVAPALATAPPKRRRDPPHLRKQITIIDCIIFGATLLASAVVYLLTLYVGKNFGAPNQYIEAIAVGFLGQTLTGVAAFPLERSMHGSDAKA
jgi:hypothetical protein